MNKFTKTLSLLIMLGHMGLFAQTLAIVNGKEITTEVAPKDFDALDKQMQTRIIERLIEKRLASDFALSTDIIKSETYIKSLEHVLQMSESKEKGSQTGTLADTIGSKQQLKGYTPEQLESKKGLLAFDFILNEQAETLKPSEKELKEHYELNKYKYDTPQMIELLTIVVSDKKTAQEIIQKLQSAEDSLKEFATLAGNHSLAPSKDNYGYFGKLPVAELNNELKPVLQNMKRNEFTKTPIQSEFGYHIYYVLNDIPEFQSTFEDVRSRVEDELIQKQVKQWAMNKIVELKKDAQIKIVYN